MIRFACPTCGNALSAPTNQGGAVTSCPHCKQLVQVPQMRVPDTKVKVPHGAPTTAGRARRESRTFWSLCRLSVWGLSFAVILLAIGTYVVQIGGADTAAERSAVSLQCLFFVIAAYYFARTFDDISKSLGELRHRMRRKP
jgi:hypothetical protein